MDNINLDAIAGKAAGLAGAVVSMHFLQGTWPARISLAISGALFSYFAAPYLSQRTGLPEGLAGFLLGLFGMAVVSRVWEWVQTTPVAAFWSIVLDWMKKRGGSV